MNSILQALANKVQEGLDQAAITSRSEWAEAYRIMPKPFDGPWTFKHHPWLYEMHNCDHHKIIGKKAAQMGFSEWVINVAFHSLDVNNESVLYVLPTTADAGQFSVARFDLALDLSPHIRDIFCDVNNVKIKRARNSILYIRGSHSRSQLKSIPAPVLIFDEMEEMPEGMPELAEYRASGQLDYLIIMLSTPHIQGDGIDKEFQLSTQDFYYFKCPGCSRFIMLEFPDSLIITADEATDPNVKHSFYICTKCKKVLDHELKPEILLPVDFGGTARFVSSFTDRDAKGFHVNGLYSSARAGRPEEKAKKALLAQLDDTVAQEFNNSGLGECYEAEGARVQESQFNLLKKGYHSGIENIHPDMIRTMGVDVGAVLNIVVKEFYNFKRDKTIDINLLCRAKLLHESESSGSPDDFNEARQIFKDFKCRCGVVDIEPELRAALTFAQSLYGRIYLCDWLSSRSVRRPLVNEEELSVKVNRTMWFDTAQGRYKNGTIDLPFDVTNKYKSHITAPVRVLKEDKYGNPFAIYISSRADHYALADIYSEIALPIATKAYDTEDINQ